MLQQGQKQEHGHLAGASGKFQQWEAQSQGQLAGVNETAFPQALSDPMGWMTGKKEKNMSNVITQDWKLGDHVQLIGLKQEDYNGLTGRIVEQIETGTWRIALDTTHRRFEVDADHLSVEVLKPGVKVQLQHLKQAKYNGRTGRVLALVPATKRWQIMLDGKEQKNISVKFSNINTKALLQDYRDEQKKQKKVQEEHKKEIKKLLKKARETRDKRNGVEKIKKENVSWLGLHPCQATCALILVCIFTFWFNKLYKDAWYHTWGC